MSNDKWTEDRVLANSEESFYFERKAGELLYKSELKHTIAKAISAFANSEGGSILLGVRNDGSFDGVDKIHKGNAETSEWLGDVIKTLLVPRVQRVHIGEVTPSVDSLIPMRKILIAIDVEKSEHAPHQSSVDSAYYYRVDKQSNAAPHNYIENLFNREKFPGPKIAEAWVYTVINPLINSLKFEARYLADENWGFRRSSPNRLKSVERITEKELSGNFEQFFQHNDEILRLVASHDEMVDTLAETLRICHVLICEGGDMEEICRSVTTLASLQKLQDRQLCDQHGSFHDCRTREDFLNKVFSPSDRLEIIPLFAELIINNVQKLHENNFAPLWNLFQSEIMIHRDMTFANQLSSVREASSKLQTANEQLISAMSEEKKTLCRKQMIPYDEPPPTVIPVPSHNRFV